MISKKRLKTGLDILLGEEKKVVNNQENTITENTIISIPISKVTPNIGQPRKKFNEEKILELSKSIKNQGLLVPIIVKKDKSKKDCYIIVAGERRWRASKLAGLKNINAILNISNEINSAFTSIIENVQREDLSPLEEAEAYKKLIDNYQITHEKISKFSGKSRSYITNLIRILDLPIKAKEALLEGKITFGHARTLLGLEEIELKNTLAQILDRDLSVRETENRVRNKKNRSKHSNTIRKKDINILDYEKYLSIKLGYQVIINDKKGKGTLSVKYKNLEQLESIIKFFNS